MCPSGSNRKFYEKGMYGYGSAKNVVKERRAHVRFYVTVNESMFVT
jgi:hypothetical protein